ncbi:hypothetical protein ACTQ4K_14880 [Clostridium sporogenes]|uniref:hypothetical protein n=1 Tax=Clostridium sporogenes TaxID=1509 RepID=UPI003F8F7F00
MIRIIAWIVLIHELISGIYYLKKTLTDKDVVDRACNFVIGVPFTFITAYLAYYVLYIK